MPSESNFLLFASSGKTSGDHDHCGRVVDDIEAEVAELRRCDITFEELPGDEFADGIRVDPAGQSAWFKLAGRNEVMDAMIASLDGHLAVPLSEAQAVYRALAASGVYRELVYESGWTPQHFQQWLADALHRHLFGTAAAQ
jgi:hypothetical protein